MARQPKLEVDMTGVQSTMLATLYLKAWDSRSKHPVLGDHMAAELVERIDYDFDGKIGRRTARRMSQSTSVRPKLFDEWTVDFLRRFPEATVLHLGCGLDSRAFRLTVPDGVQWFDVDLPDVIELRRQLYPERTGYRMIGASVTDPEWLEEIPTNHPVLILAEGLLMYLTEVANERLLRRLTDRFEEAGGELVFDGLARWEVRLSQRMAKTMTKRGYPTYSTAMRDGRQAERWNPRLRYVEDVSTVSWLARLPGRRRHVTTRLLAEIPAFRNTLRIFRYQF